MNKYEKIIKTCAGNISLKSTLFVYRNEAKGGFIGLLCDLYKLLLRIINMSVFPVMNAEVYEKATGNVTLQIIEQNREGVCGNIIMVDSPQQAVLSTKPLSDIRLQVYNNVCIRGNSDAIVDIVNNCVIYETAYNMHEDEDVVDGLLYRTRDNVCLLRDNLRHKKHKMDTGIMISGKFCFNYYHIIYENLIRLLYIDNIKIPKDVPIIIDSQTMEIASCRRIFEILTNKTQRPVIQIESNKVYFFKRLYYIDHVNRLPSHSIHPFSKKLDYLYSSSTIIELRERLLPYRSSKKYPRKVFISRIGASARNYNEEAVFNVLKRYGFERVTPQGLSFEDQMALFNSAEYIVASSGAALSNLLFVNHTCTVLCFGISTIEKVRDIPIFNTIAMINGAKFLFIPRKKTMGKGVHSDYEIDCERLDEIMALFFDNSKKNN